MTGGTTRVRTYWGETQAERSARREQQFLDAGLELFGTTGYRQATVRQLCRQAKLTNRYFYEAFGSTEDLLIAVHVDCIRKLREQVTSRVLAAGSAATPEELVRSTLDAFFTAVEDSRLARVVWLEVRGVSPRVDQTYTASLREFATLLLRLARSFHPHLDEANDLHRMTIIGMIGAISESAKQWLLNDYRESREVMVEAGTTIFLALNETFTRDGKLASS